MSRVSQTDRRVNRRADSRADRRYALEQGARRANRYAQDQMHAGALWHVILALSGKEFSAQKALTRSGTFAYLPLTRRYRRVNRYVRDKAMIAYPAMAGYLFASFSGKGWQEGWHEITKTKNVYGILGVAGRPLTLDGLRLAEFVKDNRCRFEAAQEEQYMPSGREFTLGDRVRIIDGPFEGHIVDVSAIKGRKARILMRLLGEEKRVIIPLDMLEKAC